MKIYEDLHQLEIFGLCNLQKERNLSEVNQ